MRRRAVLVVLCLALAPTAQAQFKNRATLRGKTHEVTVPAGWSVQLGQDSVTYVPPRGRTAGVNLYAVARKGQNDPFEVAEHYVKDFTGKLPHLSVSETRATRLAGLSGALKVLAGTANKVPQEMWVAVSMAADTIYVFTAFASLTELAILEKDLKAIMDGVVPPTGPRPAPSKPEKADTRGEEALQKLDQMPPLPQPSSARPLIDDPLLGLVVDAVPDWGVAVAEYGYILDRRLGQGKRLLVILMLADKPFTGDGAAFAGAVSAGGPYTWERYAGRTSLMREAYGGSLREMFLLRRGLPLRAMFIVRGTPWGDPAAEAARKQLEKVLRVSDPVRPDPSAPRLRVTIGGIAAIDVPRGWSFRTYGTGANAIFDGPGGAQARVVVETKLQLSGVKPGAPLYEWPAPTCGVDGSQPALTTTRVAGREARLGECPRDVEQALYTVDAGTHWIRIALASPLGPKAAVLAAFPKALRLL